MYMYSTHFTIALCTGQITIVKLLYLVGRLGPIDLYLAVTLVYICE